MAAKICRLFQNPSSVAWCRSLLTTSNQIHSSATCSTFSQSWVANRKRSRVWGQQFRMATTAGTQVTEVKGEEAQIECVPKSEPVELEFSGQPEPDVLQQEGPSAPPSKLEETSDSNPGGNSTTGTADAVEEKKPFVRIPKMKAALLLSYSGQGYCGMQIQNNGTRTIENDFMKALLDAGFVDEEGFQKPKSLKFQRAARTDKNVSAARNIISLMLPKTFEVDRVNEHLPDQIRVMDFRKVTKGFDAKLACCARTYLYMIPTFAFVPLEESVQENYRITPEVLENLRRILSSYEGTKNYHNFTSRKKPTDPSAFRFIMSFTSSDPFVKDGLEYVVMKVKGQSFMLHQIRKMIGLVVAILRGFASDETMKKSFTLDRIDIPMAPGLGLMLGETHYDHYNKKFGSDGIHQPLLWDNLSEKIEEFCQNKIYTFVTQTENEEKSMMQWLTTVPFHTYDIRDIDKRGGFGPIGQARVLVSKLNGEESEDEYDEEEEEDDIPRKKQKHNN